MRWLGVAAAIAAIAAFSSACGGGKADPPLDDAALKIEPIATAKIGDNSTGYRLKITANGHEFETQTIMFRHDAVLAMASTGAVPDSDDYSHVEAVAKQIDERTQKALKH